ncbi:histidine kinase [Streptomyces sp. NPDC004610]|uniref:sensor histidine kinase n=1 Tax=unclassified Streptomyces TaxID=2593676 RepID=UPI0033B7FD3B
MTTTGPSDGVRLPEPPPWSRRPVARVTRWVRRAVVDARAVPRRTVVTEAWAAALAAVFCLAPLLLLTPDRPVQAVLEALWVALLLPARRGRPVAAVLGVSVLLVGANVWTLAVAPLIVLSSTRRIAPARRAWRVVVAASAIVTVLTVALSLGNPGDLPLNLAGNGVSVVLLIVLPAVAGTLVGRRRPLVSLLRERNAYLEQARALTDATARLEERNRIAGEMHDLLGHRLSLISVHAGALELAAERRAPALAGQAELLRTTAGSAMEELRGILGVLRHGDLTDRAVSTGAETGTLEDITALVAESRDAGSPVALHWSLPAAAELPPPIRQAVHRVVREGLTNVLKHAGKAATTVVVRETEHDGDGRTGERGRVIELWVANEAPRAPVLSHGGSSSGLVGCQERVALLGGTFEAGRTADGGFRMAARLPATDGRVPEPPGARPAPARPAAPSAGTGARAPLSGEILTWPRVLGAGCAALLVVLPTAGFVVLLLVLAVLR